MGQARAGIAGQIIDGSFKVGLYCFGVHIGTDKFIRFELFLIAEEIVKDAVNTRGTIFQ